VAAAPFSAPLWLAKRNRRCNQQRMQDWIRRYVADQAFTIPDGTTAGQLHDTLSQMAAPMVVETLEKHRKKLRLQNNLKKFVTYAHKILKERRPY